MRMSSEFDECVKGRRSMERKVSVNAFWSKVFFFRNIFHFVSTKPRQSGAQEKGQDFAQHSTDDDDCLYLEVASSSWGCFLPFGWVNLHKKISKLSARTHRKWKSRSKWIVNWKWHRGREWQKRKSKQNKKKLLLIFPFFFSSLCVVS